MQLFIRSSRPVTILDEQLHLQTTKLCCLAKLFIKADVDTKMDQYGITPEKLQEILKWVKLSGGGM